MKHARDALTHTDLYEAGMSGFTLRVHAVLEGSVLPSQTTTWGQLAAGLELFTLAAFTAPAESPSRRRYIIPGVIPSLIETLSVLNELEKKPSGEKCLADLPVHAGRPLLLAWWVATYRALLASDLQRVRKLVEACRGITVRLRLQPSPQQLLMDWISWSGQLHTLLKASAESLLDYALAICGMPALEGHWESVPKLLKKAGELGVTFRGDALTRNTASCFFHLRAVYRSGDFKAAFDDLRAVYPDLANSPTFMLRYLQTNKGLFATTTEVAAMLAYGLGSLLSALLHEEVAEEDINTSFLFGDKESGGFMHLLVQRRDSRAE